MAHSVSDLISLIRIPAVGKNIINRKDSVSVLMIKKLRFGINFVCLSTYLV